MKKLFELFQKNIVGNLLFLTILLGAIICLVNRDRIVDIPMVSIPNATIEVNGEQVLLEQTWLPSVKGMSGIDIPYVTNSDGKVDIDFQIMSDDYAETLIGKAVETDIIGDGNKHTISIEFPKIRLSLTERYRMKFIINTNGNVMLIDAGSNHGGCSINGENAGCGTALTIKGIKFSRMFWMFGILFPIFVVSLAFMLLFGRKFEECAGLSVGLEILVLYIFGLIRQLEIGVYVIFIISFVALILSWVVLNLKRIDIKSVSSIGMAVFLGMSLSIVMHVDGIWLGETDEYVHWGIAAKDMFLYDSFAYHEGSTVELIRYMPFTTLVEYYYEYINGMFSQSILYIAYQILLLSFIIVLIKPKAKSWVINWIGILAVVLMPSIIIEKASATLYVDVMLAVVGGYTLFSYLNEKINVFNILRILVGLISLVLIKDMGLVFALCIGLVMLGSSIYSMVKKGTDWKSLFITLAMGLVVLITFVSWQWFLAKPIEPEIDKNPIQAKTVISAKEIEITSNVKLIDEETDVSEEIDVIEAEVSEVTDVIGADTSEEADVIKESSTVETVEVINVEEIFVEGVNVAANTEISLEVDVAEKENAGTRAKFLENMTTVNASKLSWQGIRELLAGEASEYKYESIKSYIVLLFQAENFKVGIWKISYLGLWIVILVIIIMLNMYSKNLVSDSMKNAICVWGSAGILGYATALEILYVFAFSEVEALIHHSSERYLQSFMGVWLIALIGLMIWKFDELETQNKFVVRSMILILSAVLILEFPIEGFLYKKCDTKVTADKVYGYDEIEEVFRSFASADDSVQFVCCNGSLSRRIFGLAVCPIKTPTGYVNIVESDNEIKLYDEIYYYNDVYNGPDKVTKQDFVGRINSVDYLFIFNIDDVFIKSYGDLFDVIGTEYRGSWYKVNPEAECLLSYGGSVGIKQYL